MRQPDRSSVYVCARNCVFTIRYLETHVAHHCTSLASNAGGALINTWLRIASIVLRMGVKVKDRMMYHVNPDSLAAQSLPMSINVRRELIVSVLYDIAQNAPQWCQRYVRGQGKKCRTGGGG